MVPASVKVVLPSCADQRFRMISLTMRAERSRSVSSSALPWLSMLPPVPFISELANSPKWTPPSRRSRYCVASGWSLRRKVAKERRAENTLVSLGVLPSPVLIRSMMTCCACLARMYCRLPNWFSTDVFQPLPIWSVQVTVAWQRSSSLRTHFTMRVSLYPSVKYSSDSRRTFCPSMSGVRFCSM